MSLFCSHLPSTKIEKFKILVLAKKLLLFFSLVCSIWLPLFSFLFNVIACIIAYIHQDHGYSPTYEKACFQRVFSVKQRTRSWKWFTYVFQVFNTVLGTRFSPHFAMSCLNSYLSECAKGLLFLGFQWLVEKPRSLSTFSLWITDFRQLSKAIWALKRY